MEVYCINLAHRTDKWKQTISECDKLGIHVKRVEAIAESSGWEGCRKSHLSILSKAKPMFMILEDDVKFTGTMHDIEQCMSDLPSDWDMLYLGANLQAPIEKYSDKLYRLKSAYGTHAIIYNSQRVVDFIVQKNAGGRKIDVFYAEQVMEKFNVFATRPMLATQRPSLSDISQSYQYYTHLEDGYNKYTT
jgi:GR25 family glycosyltransferase involved in LPS biosynthesis